MTVKQGKAEYVAFRFKRSTDVIEMLGYRENEHPKMLNFLGLLSFERRLEGKRVEGITEEELSYVHDLVRNNSEAIFLSYLRLHESNRGVGYLHLIDSEIVKLMRKIGINKLYLVCTEEYVALSEKFNFTKTGKVLSNGRYLMERDF